MLRGNLLKRLIVGLSAFLFLGIQLLLSQSSGTLTGKVIDKNTNEPLIGANIVVLNTSLGAASDYEGKFTMYGVPIGKKSLKVSYIGYEPVTIEVDVKPGVTDIGGITLTPQALMGEEVVVTAQVRGQQAAVNQQLTANTIKNVVSSERIHELPDASAADALSRLPGISLMDGDKVSIRGIQAKYNVVLMNGIQLPSTDFNDRSVNLGFVSSNMLSGLEVIKVITPDMDANAIGGVVNLKLMEAPPGYHFDLLAQGVYNAQNRTSVNDNQKFWVSVSNRFFSGKFGVFAQGYLNKGITGIDQSVANYQLNSTLTVPYGEAVYVLGSFRFSQEENIQTNRGGSVTLDYALPNGKIIFQNSIAQTDNDLARYYIDLINPELTISINRDKHIKQLLTNALYVENTIGSIKTELNLSHSYSDKKTKIRYGDPGDNFGFYYNYPFGYTVRSNGQRVPVVISNWGLLTPEEVYHIPIIQEAYDSAAMTQWAFLHDEKFTQHLYTGKLDISVPVSITDYISSSFKVGTKYDYSTRNNDRDDKYQRAGDLTFFTTIGDFAKMFKLSDRTLDPKTPPIISEFRKRDYKPEYFMDGEYEMKSVVDRELIDLMLPLSASGWTYGNPHRANSKRYDFDGKERFIAGYLMGEFKFLNIFSLLSGIRYEEYNMKYTSWTVYQTQYDGDADIVFYKPLNEVNRTDVNWFPNAQIKFNITQWADIRAAYTKSISRPDYNAIMPVIHFEPGTSASCGAPNLKPTVATNYDLSTYIYRNDIGLLTISGFYKKLNNLFLGTSIYYQHLGLFDGVIFPDSATWKKIDPTIPGSVLSFGQMRAYKISTYINNPYPGYLKGFEIDWQTNFWYLPKPLNSVVLNINYTRTWSDVDYLIIQLRDSSYKEGPFTKYVYMTEKKIAKGRLLQQPSHILNVALGIDYKGFSGRISCNYKDEVTSVVGVRPEEFQYTGPIYRWDFSTQQKLPWEGLSVAFNGINVFRAPIRIYRDFRKKEGQEITHNLTTTIYSPSFYEFVLRYAF